MNEGNAALSRCVIKNCANDFNEGDGGGIYHLSGKLQLTDCTIFDCEAGFDGGAIVAFANMDMLRTVIIGNNALEGGGLLIAGGASLLRDCTISSNLDFGFGGGGIKNLAVLAMDDCTVNGNNSFIGGAGIQTLGQLSLTNCTISGNSCSAPNGAAILVSTIDADGSSFSNVMCQITDCTIASNISTVTGGIGGIENDGGIISLRATILADNGLEADFSGALNSQRFQFDHGHQRLRAGGQYDWKYLLRGSVAGRVTK